MGSNKRDLKAYVRYDGSGRVVAGSLVLRRQKPKVGKWKEVQGYQCCNQAQQTIIVNIQNGYPFSYPDFVVESDDGPYTYFFNGGTNVTVNNLTELVAYNNSQYHNIGTFTENSGEMYFTPTATIAAIFAANGTTTLAAYSFAD